MLRRPNTANLGPLSEEWLRPHSKDTKVLWLKDSRLSQTPPQDRIQLSWMAEKLTKIEWNDSNEGVEYDLEDGYPDEEALSSDDEQIEVENKRRSVRNRHESGERRKRLSDPTQTESTGNRRSLSGFVTPSWQGLNPHSSPHFFPLFKQLFLSDYLTIILKRMLIL